MDSERNALSCNNNGELLSQTATKAVLSHIARAIAVLLEEMATPIDFKIEPQEPEKFDPSYRPSPEAEEEPQPKPQPQPESDTHSCEPTVEAVPLNREPHETNLHGLLASLKIPDGLREKFHIEKKMPVRFVVVGNYHIGKSALINAMFYKKAKGYQEVAKEAVNLKPTTWKINEHEFEVDGITYYVCDTMGLRDGKKRDREYVKKIKEIFTKAHLIIYCTKFQEPIRPEDISTLRALTRECGKLFWENAVIALTFANAAAPNKRNNPGWFGNFLEMKKQNLRECFINDLHISEEVWCRLSQHTVPVGNTLDPSLPGINDWRAEFWHVCVAACADKAKGAVAALAWKEEAFYEMLASSSVATLGTTAVAAGIALTVAGVVTSATTVGLPVGIYVAVVGLVALVGGVSATAVSKRRASESSEKEKEQ